MGKTPVLLFLSGRPAVAALISVVLATVSAGAQHFQFSQYEFSPLRVNPARVASTDFAQLAFIYRRQGTDGGFNLKSNSLTAMYPFISRKGKRWSGIGLSLLDDRTGQAGIFVTQEAGLAYAINISPAVDQSLSLGTRLVYQNRRMDLAGLYTGSQYIPDRGFDESMSPGENFGEVQDDYLTFSAGLHWQKSGEEGEELASVDISFFDLNRPAEQLMTASSRLNPSLVAAAMMRLFTAGRLDILPRVLYTRSASNNVFNTGAHFRYRLLTDGPATPSFVNILTSCVWGRSAILGLQFHNSRLAVGVSYDLPLSNANVSNTGAVEVGLMLKKEVSKKARKRTTRSRKSKRPSQPPGSKRLSGYVGMKRPVQQQRDSSQTSLADDKEPPGLAARLRQKADSVTARGTVGDIQHAPLVLEKATLRFGFAFNSAEPGDDARAYLDDLVQALHDNPDLRLVLVGHTDNVGSDKFNLRLSVARAQALKDYLVQGGISADRVTVEGKGMREPLNGNANAEEQALNRRVELTILYAR